MVNHIAFPNGRSNVFSAVFLQLLKFFVRGFNGESRDIGAFEKLLASIRTESAISGKISPIIIKWRFSSLGENHDCEDACSA